MSQVWLNSASLLCLVVAYLALARRLYVLERRFDKISKPQGDEVMGGWIHNKNPVRNLKR